MLFSESQEIICSVSGKFKEKGKRKKSKLPFFFKQHNTRVMMESRWEMRPELRHFLWTLQYKLGGVI